MENACVIGCDCFEKSSVRIASIKNAESIGNYAFRSYHNLEEVAIFGSLYKVPDFCFKNCNSLIRVDIPDGIEAIGGDAFSECTSLPSICIPECVLELESYAFFGCRSMTAIGIKKTDGSVDIDEGTIMLPSGIKHIGDGAFAKCDSIRMVESRNWSGT